MPIVHVHLATGQDDAAKQRLMLAVTDAIEASIGAKRAAIRVMLHEFPRDHFMAGGIVAAPSRPT